METILAQYDSALPLIRRCADHSTTLLNSILTANKIQAHSITSRIKTRNSLADKILRKSHSYNKLGDITDIIGLRVITHLPEEVDVVSRIIESEFQIDAENSVDKRQILAPDRFGYLSVHYVVQLHENRLRLVEYQDFRPLKMEIQIRSILQHAWAEIQHDLGYKTKGEVPSQIKRRFYRLAGLLEVADDEFSRLRSELFEYQSEVRQELGNKATDLELNRESLTAFVSTSSEVKSLDEAIAKATNTSLEDQASMGNEIPALQYLGITTIRLLDQALTDNREVIPKMAVEICGTEDNGGFFTRGISVFYLCYALATKDSDLEQLQIFLTFWGKKYKNLAEELLTARRNIKDSY